MKTLILFLCSIATSPQCYQTPERIEIRYESNQLCHKVAQQSAAALLHDTLSVWLIGYECDSGQFVHPPKSPKIRTPNNGTLG